MFVAAKCTQCGANIEVDSTKEAGICPCCETAFITEKAVHNYNINNITNNTYNTVNNIQGKEIHIHQGENSDKLYNDIKGLIQRKKLFDEWGSYNQLFEDLFAKFERLNPLDYRVIEIKLLIKFAHIEKDAHIKGAIYSHVDFELLDNLSILNPELGEKFYKKYLDLVNDDLNKRINGFKFEGDMLDLKVLLNVYEEPLETYIIKSSQSQRDYQNSLRQHQSWELNHYGPEPIIIKPISYSLYCPYLGSQKIVNMIKEHRNGIDENYLSYIYKVANKYKTNPNVWEGNAQIFITLLTQYISKETLNTLIRREQEEEENRRKEFYAKHEKEYLQRWTRYVNARNVKEAYAILFEMTNKYRELTPYAEKVLASNFKKGLFGYKKINVISDNNAEELTKISLEIAYKNFKNK